MSSFAGRGLRLATVVWNDLEAAAHAPRIWTSAHTCWWTHRVTDLYFEIGGSVPHDPRGGVLLIHRDPAAFINAATDNPNHYGKHGLRAFTSAHHGNILTTKGSPTCLRTWTEYNDLLDESANCPRILLPTIGDLIERTKGVVERVRRILDERDTMSPEELDRLIHLEIETERKSRDDGKRESE